MCDLEPDVVTIDLSRPTRSATNDCGFGTGTVCVAVGVAVTGWRVSARPQPANSRRNGRKRSRFMPVTSASGQKSAPGRNAIPLT